MRHHQPLFHNDNVQRHIYNTVAGRLVQQLGEKYDDTFPGFNTEKYSSSFQLASDK